MRREAAPFRCMRSSLRNVPRSSIEDVSVTSVDTRHQTPLGACCAVHVSESKAVYFGKLDVDSTCDWASAECLL